MVVLNQQLILGTGTAIWWVTESHMNNGSKLLYDSTSKKILIYGLIGDPECRRHCKHENKTKS